eukprot:CAMPEP_0175065334 /NCGR_PEP_ID=MMETSP0052_2-20121109/15861_1 /TAXON_ID=51329 ORGANISM="Polytomella parva, Strain SAG 63-3" /NCGR_SAMPLE_ID=MMETSP0052_2 /ASSEMBLY_ACC=CAM_ASM_000194 /LENGTH=47 /DNA_ID= /DNA_START= /DNA_END= /DNA_ORIENTATION=
MTRSVVILVGVALTSLVTSFVFPLSSSTAALSAAKDALTALEELSKV